MEQRSLALLFQQVNEPNGDIILRNTKSHSFKTSTSKSHKKISKMPKKQKKVKSQSPTTAEPTSSRILDFNLLQSIFDVDEVAVQSDPFSFWYSYMTEVQILLDRIEVYFARDDDIIDPFPLPENEFILELKDIEYFELDVDGHFGGRRLGSNIDCKRCARIFTKIGSSGYDHSYKALECFAEYFDDEHNRNEFSERLIAANITNSGVSSVTFDKKIPSTDPGYYCSIYSSY